VTKTLLVVDDSATMRKVFELTLLGEEVTLVAHDGSDSLLARARDARPAAAIVDVNLGANNGYDVCRALKSDAVIGRMPVLLLFSEQNPIDEAKLKECGAEGSISKPFESQALIDRVKQLLSTSQSQLAAVQQPSPKQTATIGVSPAAAAPVTPLGAPVPAPAAGKPATPVAPASAGLPAANPLGGARPKATQMFAPNVAPPGAPATPPTASPVVAPSAPVAPPAAAITPPPAVAKPAIVAPPAGAVVAPKPAVVAPPPAKVEAPVPAPVTAPVAARAAAAAPAVKLPADLEAKVSALGLTPSQVEAVSALTREVVERVVWEVVPQLAETMIREELRRLTSS
jgi:CheY-like chemotaxis protein